MTEFYEQRMGEIVAEFQIAKKNFETRCEPINNNTHNHT